MGKIGAQRQLAEVRVYLIILPLPLAWSTRVLLRIETMNLNPIVYFNAWQWTCLTLGAGAIILTTTNLNFHYGHTT